MSDLPFPQMRTRETSWPAYYEAIQGRPARALLKRLLEHAPTPSAGMHALDLGCGDGAETEALARAGWSVTATDLTPEAVELTRRRVRAMSHVEVVQGSFADFEFPACDLLYAGLSLPFGPGAEFPAVWQRLVSALRPGAHLGLHLLGDRDSWAPDPEMTFVPGSALPALLRGLEILEVRELDEDGDAFSGPKHWHVFEVIARRPAA